MKTQDVNYFDLFIDSANLCYKAAKQLHYIEKDYTKIPEEITTIHEIEREGDELYHKLFEHLERSFITPIEREDILQIAKYIEDTIDAIDEVSIMISMLSITTIRSDAKQLIALIEKSCCTLLDAAREFKNFKKSKQLLFFLIEINRIEEDGDKLYQNAIKKLFIKEQNVLEVLKWKSIFDALEKVLDTAEKAADIMGEVIIKNS